MSKSEEALAPIRKAITVHVPPKRAFDVFTKEMNRWWPAEYTAFPRETIVIEPKRGGRWFERGTEGSEGNTGKVLDWQAPERVLLAWQVDGRWKYDPDLITELDVRFIGYGYGGTMGHLERRTVMVFGPVADPSGDWGVGIVRVEDEAAVRALEAGDPAVTTLGFRYEILPMPVAIMRD